MRLILRHLPASSAAVVFGCVVADAHAEFQLLPPWACWLLIGVCLALVALLSKGSDYAGRRTFVLLSLGAVTALSVRVTGYEPMARRSPPEWEAAQAIDNERLVAEASARFEALCADTQRAARDLARSTPIALASEGSDAEDYLSGAFETLRRYPYPRAHPRGSAGATLYDTWRRPLAWSGENISLHAALEQPHGIPPASMFITDQGVYTYLVALEPLVSRRGFVSVEVPLSADRRLDNRYLEDYDAISTWLARTSDTELLPYGQDPAPLAALFEDKGDPFWDANEGNRRLYFSLRAPGGALLGMSSIAGDGPATARQRARRDYRSLAGWVLLAAVGASLGAMVVRRVEKWTVLLLLWSARLILFLTELPIGLGLGLDHPGEYASALFWGLSRSPADLFLTTGVLFLSVVILAAPVSRWGRTLPTSATVSVLMSVVGLGVFVATNTVIQDAWSNSNLALASVSPIPFDGPRLTVQFGFVLLFLAASVTVTVLLSLVSGRRPEIVVVTDVVILAAFLSLLSQNAMRDLMIFALPPFVIARALALARDGLEDKWASAGIYARLATLGLLAVAAVSSFYPALARFESTTARAFVEDIVAPAVLQHGASTLETLSDVARSIDVMLAEGQLEAIDRQDITYRIWVGTELVSSSLSSSIEVLDSEQKIASKFSLSLPAFDDEPPRRKAPDAWIIEEEPGVSEAKHPGYLLARRTVPGPEPAKDDWEIRVRLAADWRNLPFVSTTNPYLHLFRVAGNDVPSRLRLRTLALFVLELDGNALYQSSGGAIRLAEPDIRESRRGPIWREYTVQGQAHRAYLFSDGRRTFVLSYPRTSLLSYAAEAAGWAVLALLLGLVLFAVMLLAGSIGASCGVSSKILWAGIRQSFSGKLYVAFVLIALLPIASLAFVIRGIVLQQLQGEVERDGRARAEVVERLVQNAIATGALPETGGTIPNVTDTMLESVGSLAGVDVDLYSGGDLVATSKPELVGSGLLRARTVPSAYRDLVLGSATESIHREAVGSFEYLVVSVPIRFEPNPEPAILALPLASQRDEIDARVSALNQTLLLAALGFSLAAAALAYSLARRISGPIHTLTEATHRVASGDLNVSLQTKSQDEIGGLFDSFTQMTSDLKRRRVELEHSKKLEAWAEMARQVAHEVKNPLTPIQLATEHILRVYRDPKVDFSRVLTECTETILQQVKSLRQISMEFSTFASPESLRLDQTNVGELVREVVGPYVASPPNGISLAMTIAPNLPLIEADARLLKRTVHNLVENALHALNAGGRVEVGVLRHSENGSGFVELFVEDTGVGIDPELKERIFEPYFSTRAAGTGLGLAIAKKVVEDHGGTISLASELGKGTRVQIRLPIVARRIRDDDASERAS